ncbi:MAG: PilZ domain-containing protein [Thiohalomonadales bacterium]|nr:PilZ domain-containing protein [Thiohalomonadales bacterium]
MSNFTEKRRFTRIPFEAETRISDPATGAAASVQLLDISLKGALTTLPPAMKVKIGDNYVLELLLAASDTEITLKMEANLIHTGEEYIGFQYQHMDLDTATHLHRLIELNLGDEKLMERELAELAAYHD